MIELRGLINKPYDMIDFVYSVLKPKEIEKKQYGEVYTPLTLVSEMIMKLEESYKEMNDGKSIFSNPNLKWFDPCVGIGNFMSIVYYKLMNGLKDEIKDREERKKHIFENMLYMSELGRKNVEITRLVFDGDKYKLNLYHGDTLKLDIKEEWGIDGFDIVLGNPPYQNDNNNKGSGNTLWNLFVDKSLNEWLIEKGLLLYVHPRGWRQINSKVGNLMKTKQIIYLNMNSVSKGLETFKCATDYDYYLIENICVYKETNIVDYKNKKYKYMINKELKFIPNHSLNEVFSLVDSVEDNGFINDQSSYEPRKKWMSKNQSNEYKYPCVYSINSKNIISKKWSNRNDNGHFNVTKFIFSNGSGYYKDINGEYGLTQWAYAIKCNKEDMDNVEKSFNSNKFINIVDAINLTSNKYNYNVMKLFKKDFWKEFI